MLIHQRNRSFTPFFKWNRSAKLHGEIGMATVAKRINASADAIENLCLRYSCTTGSQ